LRRKRRAFLSTVKRCFYSESLGDELWYLSSYGQLVASFVRGNGHQIPPLLVDNAAHRPEKIAAMYHGPFAVRNRSCLFRPLCIISEDMYRRNEACPARACPPSVCHVTTCWPCRWPWQPLLVPPTRR
jgi:hypothetical protein